MKRMIGAYWNFSDQNSETMANEVSSFLNELNKFYPELYSSWFLPSTSKKRALESQIEIQPKNIMEILEKNRNKAPNGETLSQSIDVWNGEEEDSNQSSVRIRFSYNPHVPSSVVINFAYNDKYQKFLDKAENAEQLKNIILNHWKPEYIKIDDQEIWKK